MINESSRSIKSKAELVDVEKGIYGLKIVKPSSIDYFFFSENLQKEQLNKGKKSIQEIARSKRDTKFH